MDSTTGERLQARLQGYILETLEDIKTVRSFCDKEPKWTLQRETELDMMRDIKDRADQISLQFDHVKKAENKAKAFGEYLWSGLTQVTADSKREELEKELGEVLKNTLEGLEKLQHFLDAVERLAVTSLFVFMGESFLPKGVSDAAVRSVITTARIVSPLLIHFKRDAGAFFLPSLHNVDVLAFQLDKYIRITQQLCMRMEKKSMSVSCSGGIYEWKNGSSSLKLNMSEDSLQKLDDHLSQLIIIRMDESFRLTFLFNWDALHFIGLFNQRQSRMFQFLSDLEEAAVQLDRMKMGSNISTVAGSSVGIAGGVLSIVGLALAPVTAGVSLALTLTGVGLGVTSGVNGLVTGITEMAVNKHHGKNANNIFQKFMEDVEKILDCMEQVASSEGPAVDPQVMASVMEDLKSEEVARAAVNMGLQEVRAARNIPNLVADLPDIGQVAKGAPLALSKSARAGLITLNALFIGLDVLFICKDGISLAKGSKNQVSELIRCRSRLWHSELEAWRKISDCLCRGIWKFRKSHRILEQPFHP
ncbi:apolipoprotein L3-like [Colossoma macropomum]|uniref:apolipoprotein L3-like n=1 Tax=Colossoma macropomum TaxID=42526 RepID=UPI001863BB7A|nr:apolipoprotein L3-like [Colossoma macropomum]XP_036446441.1 apolipoprotein L3-like [Colossoma macropomum]